MLLKVRDGAYPKSINVEPSETTIREAFEQAGIDIDCGIVTVSGTPVRGEELDNYISEYITVMPGANQSVTLAVNRKTNNAANIIIAGKAVVVRSAVKLGDLKKVQKYKPQYLTLTETVDEEKVPTFKVFVAATPSISDSSITFASDADDEALATVTLIPTGDVEKFATEIVGPTLLKIEAIEAGIDDALAEIDAEAEVIAAHITRV